MIKGLAHNAFKVKDMERSLHFYCDVIGLEKAFDIKDEEGNPWIIYLKISDTQEKNCVQLDSKPSQGKDLNFQCWAKDPDGNRIEFMQMDPNSLQALS